jgi:hypothetical protein
MSTTVRGGFTRLERAVEAWEDARARASESGAYVAGRRAMVTVTVTAVATRMGE